LERGLLVERRDAGVAEERHTRTVSEPSDGGRRETLISTTGCERLGVARTARERRRLRNDRL
jgi:hypothetical protein